MWTTKKIRIDVTTGEVLDLPDWIIKKKYDLIKIERNAKQTDKTSGVVEITEYYEPTRQLDIEFEF